MIDPIELRPGAKASQIPVIRLPAGGRQQVVIALVDAQGKPVAIEDEAPAPGTETPQFAYQRQLGPGNVKVRLRAKDDYGTICAALDVEGKLVEGCKNRVEFLLFDENTSVPPGVYLCEVGRFAVPDFLVDTWRCYLALEPSVFGALSGSGPITIPEIRLSLGDVEVGEVSLLDEVEFKDVEILHCIRKVVDLWNETPPFVGSFSTQDFPYRYQWTQGCIAELYKIAARKYRRNQLNYNAGGITIDDQNKAPEYQAIADQLSAEFREWMMREKVRLNGRRGWRAGI